MKKLNPKIIRVGDKVKIVNPEFFVRVGYPLTKEIVKEKMITDKEKNLITQLVGAKDKITIFGLQPNYIYDEILDRLAYHKLKSNLFGGNERKIFTEKLEEYKDLVGQVISKRYVKTGIYVSGGTSYSYDGEPDYNPPYLRDEKTHIILMINLNSFNNKSLWSIVLDKEIEATNVEKVYAEI